MDRSRKDGLHRWCKDCWNEYQRQRKAKMPEVYLAYARKFTVAQHGLDLAGYDRLLAQQGGRCAICREEPQGRALAVDHDHRCCPGRSGCPKCVRGLLCGNCNRAIGFLQDDVARATRAVEYLS